MFLFLSPTFAAEERGIHITCGKNTITGTLELEDPENTSLEVTINERDDNTIVSTLEVNLEENMYNITIDPEAYEIKEYTVNVLAIMGDQEATWTEKMMLGSKNCDTIQELEQKIETYATIVEEYFANKEDVQKVPSVFLKTGLTEYLEQVIQKTGKKFATSSSTVYHDIPTWSFDSETAKRVNFQSHYDLLPTEYRNAYAYFRYKGLLIPVQTTDTLMNEQELLALLNHGGILSPETTSLDTIGTVKMIYTHAVSTTKSPFAGVGSHLSVFSEIGDEIKIFVKIPGTSSYEERTYILQSKMDVEPDGTQAIKKFKKEGADIMAFISCKYGNILGSTEGREILFFSRKSEEIGDFQKSIIYISDEPYLKESKDAIDAYFRNRNLSDDDVKRLVTKLEELEDNGNSQLKTIATYGKYMAAYDSLYN